MKRILIITITCTLIASHVPGFAQDFYAIMRERMVRDQIEIRGVRDENVLNAMRKVERHRFVPQEVKQVAYEDRPVSIGEDQTISQPYIVAYMTEALQLKPDDKVLEIGTGSGYQAAILAEIVDQVYTIEIIKELATSARDRLLEMGYDNITVKNGDGYQGWPQQAPFDAIIITAAPPKIPAKLLNQLKVGGKMIVPVGTVHQELLLVERTNSGLKKRSLLPVRFVPMVHL